MYTHITQTKPTVMIALQTVHINYTAMYEAHVHVCTAKAIVISSTQCIYTHYNTCTIMSIP